MAKFKAYDYRQRVFLPVSLEDQLMPGTLEFAIHTLVETRLDTSVFAQRYHNDETGRIAYDPKIFLKIVLLGYARGLISSRKIERACRENVVFIASACGHQPDHSTIAAFVSSMKDEILPLFRNVLLVCQEMGLLGGTFFALDGVKLPSNDSTKWSGTYSELHRKKARLDADREVVMRKFMLIVALGSILTCFHGAIALAYLVDTGTAPLENGWALSVSQSLDGEFSLAQTATITSIEGWMYCIEAGQLVAAIYTDGGTKPGSLLYLAPFTIVSDDWEHPQGAWHGVMGLNWVLAPGTYWVSFEGATSDSGRASMWRPSEHPLEIEAFWGIANGYWIGDYPLGIGVELIMPQFLCPVHFFS